MTTSFTYWYYSQDMEKKSRNYSKIYIWHRFDQAEADCVLNNREITLKSKKISLGLMKNLIVIGKLSGELTQNEVKEMSKIVRETKKFLKKITPVA